MSLGPTLTTGPVSATGNDLLYVRFGVSWTQAPTVPSGFTGYSWTGGSNGGMSTAYRILTAPGSYSASWGIPAPDIGDTGGAGIIAFKPGNGVPQAEDLMKSKLPDGTVMSGINAKGLPFTKPQLFSVLAPFCPAYPGAEATVTDSAVSTWNSTVTGTGTAATPYTKVYCDGVHWVVR